MPFITLMQDDGLNASILENLSKLNRMKIVSRTDFENRRDDRVKNTLKMSQKNFGIPTLPLES